MQTIIESGKSRKNYWRDLWVYRELFIILSWRDISVRYKQAVMGVLWAVIRPILTMVILVLVFGRLANLPSEGVPYPVYVFSAMLPWMFFATAFSDAGNSMVGNANLISKVYFPRLIIPASAVMVAGVDFLISLVILLVVMCFYEVWPSWHLLLIPVFFSLAFITALGVGVFVAALNVQYRDFKFVIPFVAQFGMFVSPVAFSTTIVPEKYLLFYYANPLVAVIDGFRWCVSGGTTAININGMSISILVSLIILAIGVFYFRKTEKIFADVI